MKRVRYRLIISGLVLGLVWLGGCSSSGGGDGGGSNTSSASTGIRVLHGALDGAPLDVQSSASEENPVHTARFAVPNFYSKLEKAEQSVSLVRRGGGPTIFQRSLTVEDRSRFSWIVFGNTTDLGLSDTLIQDLPPEEIAAGMSAVRVVHAVANASGISARLGGVSIGAGIAFGSASAYVEVPAGVGNFSATRTADAQSIFSGAKALEEGRSYTILVTGEVDYIVLAPLYED